MKYYINAPNIGQYVFAFHKLSANYKVDIDNHSNNIIITNLISNVQLTSNELYKDDCNRMLTWLKSQFQANIDKIDIALGNTVVFIGSHKSVILKETIDTIINYRKSIDDDYIGNDKTDKLDKEYIQKVDNFMDKLNK